MSVSHNMPNSIPFLDLVTPHVELEQELTAVFHKALRTAGFIGGPMVEDFEKAFAAFCDASSFGRRQQRNRCFAIRPDGKRSEARRRCGHRAAHLHRHHRSDFASRRVARVCGHRRADLQHGSRKTAEYLEKQCTVNDAGALISRRSGRPVTAVVPVHLYGQMADMDPILELAERYRLVVIEDACQAHGAEYFSRKHNRWMKAGSMGRAAAFSFYPGKNLGACGEAGAATTNDAGLAKTMKMLRDHGQATKYYHDVEGYNGRLDAIQAGLLHVKLAHLAKWNAQRRERAAEYNRLLKSVDGAVVPPYEPSWSRAVYHLYVVRTADREGLMDHLKKAGIGTGIHYPIPLHLQKAYAAMNYRKGDFPVTEKAAAEIVSLPMFPQLTAAQQTRVVEEILNFTSMATRKHVETEAGLFSCGNPQSIGRFSS